MQYFSGSSITPKYVILLLYMSDNATHEIKDRISIEELIGADIDLIQAGKSLKGLCPFHNEKSPSFNVSPDRGSYYCFGCGAKGDVFTYIQETKGVEFREALVELAEKAGVVLESFSSENTQEVKGMHGVMEVAQKFFLESFQKDTDSKSYLKGRGVNSEIKEKFGIGYAPNDWHALENYMKTVKVSKEDSLAVGLLREGDKGAYDYFRDRIMFPICDGQGRIIAYSGRILHDDEKSAKYMNSPETPLFNKSRSLFGLHLAKPSMRKLDFSILCEGQLDVVLAHQAGWTSCVASSGTAATTEQFEILAKVSNNIIIAYDGDKAGIAAAKRAWDIALPLGLNVKVATLPDGEDPADVIVRDSEEFKDIIKNAKHVIEFVTERILQKESDTHKQIQHLEKYVMPYLKYVRSHVERSYFVSYLAQKTGLSEDTFWLETSGNSSVQSRSSYGQKVNHTTIEKKSAFDELVDVLAWQKTLKEPILAASEVLEGISLPLIVKRIEDTLEEKILDEGKLFSLEQQLEKPKLLTAHIEALVKKINKEFVEQEIKNLQAKLGGKQDEEVLGKIQELQKSIQKFRNQLGHW